MTCPLSAEQALRIREVGRYWLISFVKLFGVLIALATCFTCEVIALTALSHGEYVRGVLFGFGTLVLMAAFLADVFTVNRPTSARSAGSSRK